MKIARILFYMILLLVLCLGISFAVLNAKAVTVNYYLGVSEVPLSLLLVYALGAGILLTSLVTLFSLLKLKLENHSLKKALKKVLKKAEVTQCHSTTDSALPPDLSKPRDL